MDDEAGWEDEGEDEPEYKSGDLDDSEWSGEEDMDEGGESDDVPEVSEEGGDLASPAPADE